MRIIRLGLIGLMALLLSSCALLQRYTVDQAFKQKNYIYGINMLAKNMDQKPLPLNDWDAKYLTQKVDQLTQIAEQDLSNTTADDYDSKINSYKILLAIRTKLADKSYGEILESFNQRYTEADLKQHLVMQYYDYAQNYAGSDSAAYKRKAELYKEGMIYDSSYKDIAKQYQENLNKYYLVAAGEYYAKGTEYARQQNYKAAAESFTEADAVYRPLGHFKDSLALAKVYDKKYRTVEAERYYTQAQQLGLRGASKADYRTMASYYQQAADIYQPYGNYKNSSSLATKYQKLGNIQIYIVNHKFDDLIKDGLTQRYINYTDCRSCADLTINIFVHHRPEYDYDHGYERTENKHEKIITGYKLVTVPKPSSDHNSMAGHKLVSDHKLLANVKEISSGESTEKSVPEYQDYHYTVHQRTERNSLKLNGYLEISGINSDTRTYSGSASSERTHYWYSGQIPSNKYHSHTSGHLLSQQELYRSAYQDIITNIKYDLRRVNNALDTL